MADYENDRKLILNLTLDTINATVKEGSFRVVEIKNCLLKKIGSENFKELQIFCIYEANISF